MFLLLDVSDISGSGYHDADKAYVPLARLQVLAMQRMDKLRSLISENQLSEVREADHSILFFDQEQLPEAIQDELWSRDYESRGWKLFREDWRPAAESDGIAARELKILECSCCWTALVGDDGPVSLETNTLSWYDWKEISDGLQV